MSLHTSPTLYVVVDQENGLTLGAFLSKQSAVFFARKTLIDSGEFTSLYVEEHFLDHPCRSIVEAQKITKFKFEV